MEPAALQHRAQVLAIIAAICACIPDRPDTTVDQDVGLAAEFLESAEAYVAREREPA